MSNDNSRHADAGAGQPFNAGSRADASLDGLMAQIRFELQRPDTIAGARSADVQPSSMQVTGSSTGAPEPLSTELNVEDLMMRLRLELKQRRSDTPTTTAQSAPPMLADGGLPRWHPSAARLPFQPTYVLADLLRFTDEDFIENTYRVVLRRVPDAKEKSTYLSALRNGNMSKVEILGSVRFSEEGMHKTVHIDGLLLPYKLHQWRHVRVVGWFFSAGIALFRLPRLFVHLQRLEVVSAQESQGVGRALNELVDVLSARLSSLDGQLEMRARRDEVLALAGKFEQARVMDTQLKSDVRDHVESVEKLRTQLEVIQDSMARIESAGHESHDALRLIEQKLADQRTSIASLGSEFQSLASMHDGAERELQRQISAQVAGIARVETSERKGQEFLRMFEAQLGIQRETVLKVEELEKAEAEIRRTVGDTEQQMKKFTDQFRAQQSATNVDALLDTERTATMSHLLDAHYVSFEDTFRGTRDDVKTRARHYLPVLANAGIEKTGDLVLDLGCGRGEWLEVLVENEYTCRGVDLNTIMVRESAALGFDVIESDAIAYLQGLESDSIGAITSMHLVEHLHYEALIRLLDEALRVLRPGGVLVLETPNPENLTVGAHWFYLDPTHRNPIPPTLLQWLVQARGFTDSVIDRLTTNRGVSDIHALDVEVAGSSEINKIISLLTAAPDYAIVAIKPRRPDL